MATQDQINKRMRPYTGNPVTGGYAPISELADAMSKIHGGNPDKVLEGQAQLEAWAAFNLSVKEESLK